MAKYTIGIDFGTLAVRALICDVSNGEELASAVYEYEHGVMTEKLPDGTPLAADWALQHPLDYVKGMQYTVPEVLRKSGVFPEDVVGIGIDFTSSTTLPVDKSNVPLCLKKQFQSNSFAWPMLWKHHAAQKYADRMTVTAQKRNEKLLERCGGRISAEMMLPRLWHVAVEAPEVYADADRFVEAGDWIVRQLTGSDVASANFASYKLFWDAEDGYPSQQFLSELDDRLTDVTLKLGQNHAPLGTMAGRLTEYGAQMTGLRAGTPVGVSCIDAHTALPAAGVTSSGKMLLILGTSAAHMVLDNEKRSINGILCMAKDGVIPGWYAYEAGQSCCGDHFKWFVEQCVPSAYQQEADCRGISIHQYLTEKAALICPGQSGLIALDWWNGNRSVLMNSDLSGMLIGLTLQTKPEEIYRALIEATAFGTRVIVENFEKSGIRIDEIDVCGGIARKNPMLMQIYADVLKRPLYIVRSKEANALGSAVLAAASVGKAAGGYDTIAEAAAAMGGTEDTVYTPIAENSDIYERLYNEYLLLHDWFGRQGNEVMQRLKDIRRETLE